MHSALLVFLLSVPISADSAGVAATECEAVVAAYEEAIAAAHAVIAEKDAAIAALHEQLLATEARAQLVERHSLAMAASYERELEATRRELGASRWRRFLDTLVAGGVGFTVGSAVGD